MTRDEIRARLTEVADLARERRRLAAKLWSDNPGRPEQVVALGALLQSEAQALDALARLDEGERS